MPEAPGGPPAAPDPAARDARDTHDTAEGARSRPVVAWSAATGPPPSRPPSRGDAESGGNEQPPSARDQQPVPPAPSLVRPRQGLSAVFTLAVAGLRRLGWRLLAVAGLATAPALVLGAVMVIPRTGSLRVFVANALLPSSTVGLGVIATALAVLVGRIVQAVATARLVRDDLGDLPPHVPTAFAVGMARGPALVVLAVAELAIAVAPAVVVGMTVGGPDGDAWLGLAVLGGVAIVPLLSLVWWLTLAMVVLQDTGTAAGLGTVLRRMVGTFWRSVGWATVVAVGTWLLGAMVMMPVWLLALAIGGNGAVVVVLVGWVVLGSLLQPVRTLWAIGMHAAVSQRRGDPTDLFDSRLLAHQT